MGSYKEFNRLLYRRWEYAAKPDEVTVVQPDGCRDLLFVSRQGERDEMRFTEWDGQPRIARLRAGTTLIGYRLCPGSVLAPHTYEERTLEPTMLEDMIESEATNDREVTDLIEALSLSGATVMGVARQNGVTARTLQRRFHELSLPTPEFWRLLARARRAIQALPYRVPLVEIAHAYGYSDQAHMTREFVRWFGHPPAQLRKNKILIREISQPGLGNWQVDNPSQVDNLF